MREFFDKWARAQGQFQPQRARARTISRGCGPTRAQRKAVDAGIECIGCGVCYSACDVVAWNPDYLGPAALNRAWTLVNDVRDARKRERLRAVAGDAGCHACHTHMSCTERCPKHLSPTARDRRPEARGRSRPRSGASCEPARRRRCCGSRSARAPRCSRCAWSCTSRPSSMRCAAGSARPRSSPARAATSAGSRSTRCSCSPCAVHAPIGLRSDAAASGCAGAARSRDVALLLFAALLRVDGHARRARRCSREDSTSSYWASIVHRVSGIALALFLPLHFWALAALRCELDALPAWTEQPLVKLGRMGLSWSRSPRTSPAACGCWRSSSCRGATGRRRSPPPRRRSPLGVGLAFALAL